LWGSGFGPAAAKGTSSVRPVPEPGPGLQFGPADRVVPLPLIGGRDDPPELGSSSVIGHLVQHRVFVSGRPDQQTPITGRNAGVQEGLSVGSAPPDHRVQGGVVAGLHGRRAGPDDGQGVRGFAGLDGHDRGHAVGVQRQPEVEQRGAAGDP